MRIAMPSPRGTNYAGRFLPADFYRGGYAYDSAPRWMRGRDRGEWDIISRALVRAFEEETIDV
jgi:hypothetical protein